MKTFILFFHILVLAGYSQNTVYIQGKVTDAVTGESLSGMEVELSARLRHAPNPELEVITGSEGEYEFTGLPPAENRFGYHIRVKDDQFQFYLSDMVSPETGGVTLNIGLKKIVSLQLPEVSGILTIIDSNKSSAQLVDLEESSGIRVDHGNYIAVLNQAQQGVVSTTAFTITGENFEEELPVLEQHIEGARTLSGNMVDDAGISAPGLTVLFVADESVFAVSTKTDSLGDYQFSNIPLAVTSGEVYFFSTPLPESINISSSSDFTVEWTGTTAELDLVYQRPVVSGIGDIRDQKVRMNGDLRWNEKFDLLGRIGGLPGGLN